MSKSKKKSADDQFSLIDSSALIKLNHGTDLQVSAYPLLQKPPGQINYPQNKTPVQDPFSNPAIFGKNPPQSVRYLVPPGTVFVNDTKTPFITAKQASISENITELTEKDLINKLFPQTTRNQALSIEKELSQNQIQIVMLLKYFYSNIENFTLNSIMKTNQATQIDKTPNLFFTLSFNGQNVVLPASNFDDNFYLTQQQNITTAEGDFNLTNYYCTVLNFIYDNLKIDFLSLILAEKQFNNYLLPIYHVPKLLTENVKNKLIFIKSPTFYTILGQKLDSYFNSTNALNSLKSKEILLPILSCDEIDHEFYVKIQSPDPIISHILTDDLPPSVQDFYSIYTYNKRYKMHKFLDQNITQKTVKINDFVKPPTPKISFSDLIKQKETNEFEHTLPRLRRPTSNLAMQEEIVLKKNQELINQANEYEQICFENGLDEDLFEDETTENMDFFVVKMQNLAQFGEFLYVTEIGENNENFAKFNEKCDFKLDLSCLGLQGSTDKNSAKFTTNQASVSNQQTLVFTCQEPDFSAFLTLNFVYLEENCFSRVTVISNSKEFQYVVEDFLLLPLEGLSGGEFFVLKIEFLSKLETELGIEESILANKHICSKSGAIVKISANSKQNFTVNNMKTSESFTFQKEKIDQIAVKSNPVFGDFSTVSAAIFVELGGDIANNEVENVSPECEEVEPSSDCETGFDIFMKSEQNFLVEKYRRNQRYFTFWLQFDDGILQNTTVSISILDEYQNCLFQNLPVIVNGSSLQQKVEIPSQFENNKFFIFINQKANSQLGPDNKGKPQTQGIYPQQIRLIGYSNFDFSFKNANLQQEIQEAFLTNQTAYTLTFNNPGLFALQFFDQKFNSQIEQVQQPERENSLEIISIPPPLQNRVKSAQNATKNYNEILSENSNLISNVSAPLQILQKIEISNSFIIIFQIPENLKFTLKFEAEIQIVQYSLGVENVPSCVSVNLQNLVLNRITGAMYSKEYASYCEQFKKQCVHLKIEGKANDLAKLNYNSTFHSIVESSQISQKSKKGENVGNPAVQANSVIGQTKMIQLEVNGEELMFGGAKKEGKKPGKVEGGFFGEIFEGLKGGVSRGDGNGLFKIVEEGEECPECNDVK